MKTNELKTRLTAFWGRVEGYYGKRIIIYESISTNKTSFDRHFSTFGKYEMKLERFGARTSGGRMIFDGPSDLFYEISIDNLVTFEELETDLFEFLEVYNDTVYRKTELHFK